MAYRMKDRKNVHAVIVLLQYQLCQASNTLVEIISSKKWSGKLF